MAELERSFLVMTGADAAFEFLSDPIRLPEYVPTLRLEDSTAVEGELDVDADLTARDGAPAAGFVADRKTRRIDWGRPDDDYGGSLEVAVTSANIARVTLRLRTGAAADPATVATVVDQAVANIRRLLAGR
ncbi:MAG TPA: hypothetical protein VFK35_00305 [Candidatus Limnocylindrales bacterium]|nr:hypothetical protein [Candidatus Limnocylindrales bacterium]